MRKVKIITTVLAIILISMIGFVGIYSQTQNRMENKVKDYSYAMDLEGARNIELIVDKETKEVIKDGEGKEVTDASDLTDEQLAEKGYTKEEVPYNEEDVLNVENYKISKEKIENRLKEFGVQDYEISQNEENGEIFIKVPEDTKTDSIVSNLTTVRKI